jgi:hypothetical protein
MATPMVATSSESGALELESDIVVRKFVSDHASHAMYVNTNDVVYDTSAFRVLGTRYGEALLELCNNNLNLYSLEKHHPAKDNQLVFLERLNKNVEGFTKIVINTHSTHKCLLTLDPESLQSIVLYPRQALQLMWLEGGWAYFF